MKEFKNMGKRYTLNSLYIKNDKGLIFMIIIMGEIL